jgi:hypothetical protein
MGGGLMQLVAYGAQDIYLTGNPQITFFKVVYRRHTNFSMETIQQTFNGGVAASAVVTATISRNGDLVHKMYVTSDTNAVTNGSAIVTECELEIGGQRIDRHYTEWMQVWNELTTPESKAIGLKAMQGDIGSSNTTGVKNIVQVPLLFWFCRNPGLALPLIALQYHEVKVKITLGAAITGAAGAQLWADYIYLDTDERRRFAQVSHEYLIEQLQKETYTAGTGAKKLNFNHPVKELIWTPGAATDSESTYKLKLNGHDRFAAQSQEHFSLRQPYDYHTAVPRQNLPDAAGLGRLEEGSIADMTTVSLTAGDRNAVPAGAGNCDTNLGTGITSRNTTAVNPILINTVINDTDQDGGFSAGANATAAQVAANAAVYLFLTADLSASLAVGDIVQVTVKGVSSISAHADISSTIITKVTERLDGTATGANAGAIANANNTALRFSTPLITVNSDQGGADVNFVITNITRLATSGCRTSTLTKRICVYSFALKPEEHQPSGTCNFSRIDSAQLDIQGADDLGGNIYAVNYNVLRIMSGMGGLAYSN